MFCRGPLPPDGFQAGGQGTARLSVEARDGVDQSRDRPAHLNEQPDEPFYGVPRQTRAFLLHEKFPF
jgi:hypothetical protein